MADCPVTSYSLENNPVSATPFTLAGFSIAGTQLTISSTTAGTYEFFIKGQTSIASKFAMKQVYLTIVSSCGLITVSSIETKSFVGTNSNSQPFSIQASVISSGCLIVKVETKAQDANNALISPFPADITFDDPSNIKQITITLKQTTTIGLFKFLATISTTGDTATEVD